MTLTRTGGYHVLFGLALVALFALGSWWAIFFMHAIELERQKKTDDLVLASARAAAMAGATADPAEARAMLPEGVDLVEAAGGDSALCTPCGPAHPDLLACPSASELDEIGRKLARRRVMVFGESGLLIALLLICTFMLYRLVRQERRYREGMHLFVASISHEMKTPITGVKSMLQTFLAGNVPADREGSLYALGLSEMERLERTVENVLISGRLRTMGADLRVEPVLLAPLIEQVIDHPRTHRPDERPVLVLEGGCDPDLAVSADADSLRVVLENLVDNAIKYGGRDPAATITVSVEGDAVAVAIIDRGAGFDPADAGNIFTPFTRLGADRHSVRDGAGLGLPIARTLARAMGGDLTAASDGHGKGSSFILHLRRSTP